ncbi:hypothetical protein MMPV_006668 [Pyropia vietnamensis]
MQGGPLADDTSMALCLGDSLLSTRRASGGLGGPMWDPADVMRRFSRWYLDGVNSHNGVCFDIETTTAAALHRFLDNPAMPVAGISHPTQAGNGGLMRLAPVVAGYAHDADDVALLGVARESCRLTHGADEAVDACAAYALLLKGALRGVPRADLLTPRYPPVVGGAASSAAPAAGEATPAIARVVVRASYHAGGRDGVGIRGTGYVVNSLKAALWTVWSAADYRDAVLRAANLGDDADTTAAIAGALAGALWGEEGIPSEWRAKLAWADRVGRMGEELEGAAAARAAAMAAEVAGGEAGGRR